MSVVQVIHALINLLMEKARRAVFPLLYALYSTRLGRIYYTRWQLHRARQRYPDGHTDVPLSFTEYGDLLVQSLPYGSDNYCHLVVSKTSKVAIAVDVGFNDLSQIREQLSSVEASLAAVLCTHAHHDHSCGNKAVATEYPQVPIYGSIVDKPHCAHNLVPSNANITVHDIRVRVHDTPGHTTGSVCYQILGDSHGAPDLLFTGDTLFKLGTGRVFECDYATAAQSIRLLFDQTRAIPLTALVLSGHEYAAQNATWSLQIAEADAAANSGDEVEHYRRIAKVEREMRSNREKSKIETLEYELRNNYFVRAIVDADEAQSRHRARINDNSLTFDAIPISDSQLKRFIELRQSKDRFP